MVNYTGYTLDGKYFDTSVPEVAKEHDMFYPTRNYKPYNVVIDQSSVIPGWHDALKQLNLGAKATIYIPSTLAYGTQRLNEEIGGNSILVFDLELVEIQ